MAKHELDKKSLREDYVHDHLLQLVDWSYRHRNALIIGVSLLLAVIVAGLGYRYYRSVEQHRVTLAFFEVERIFTDESLDNKGRQEAARKGYGEFVRANPNTPLTPIAWMHLARLAWEGEDVDGARAAYLHVIGHGQSTPGLRDLARLGLAKIEESAQNLDAAEALVRKISDSPYGSLKAYNLGLIALQRNKTEEARRHFEQAAQGEGDNVVAQWARQSLDYLP